MEIRTLTARTPFLAATVTVGLLVTASLSSAAGSPVVASASPRTTSTPASGSTEHGRAAAPAVALALARTLSLPAGTPDLRRVVDAVDGTTYDEVTLRDERRRPVGIVRLGLDGRPLMAIALGLHESVAPIDAPSAVRRAAAVAAIAGVPVSGAPSVRESRGLGGWLVSWQRVAAGAPVRGDGVRVSLWADGTFHAISATERPLAPAPAKVPETAARAAAASFVASRLEAAAAALVPTRATLAWVVPNETWRPGASGDGRAHLGWVVEYRATGSLADRLVAIEIWLDAGSLAVIGGDVAE